MSSKTDLPSRTGSVETQAPARSPNQVGSEKGRTVLNHTYGAQAVTRALGGQWRGYYGTARCPVHNDRNPSLSISTGDDGKLLVNCHAGCAPLDVLAALRDRGISVTNEKPDAVGTIKKAEWRARQRARAVREWAKSSPINRTLGERYLRSRAIQAPLPKTLRFNQLCWHPSGTRLAAIVAKVVGPKGHLGVHRTYLGPDGQKALVSPQKAMLGPIRGGAVHLSDGTGPLVVSEGIETALSILDLNAMHSPRVWAALSASGVAGLELPSRPGKLIVAPDGDKAGRIAAEKLAERAHSLAWQVSALNPPDGKDWNDVAMEVAS